MKNIFRNFKLLLNTLYISIINKHIYMKSELKHNFKSSMTPMITEEYDKNIQLKSVFDKLLEDRIIYLGSPISDHVSNTINAQLLYLDSISNDPIYIYINSPGGDVYSGLSIYDTIQYINSPVYTVVTGLAASMAFIISICGEKRYALPNSKLMMHQVISGIDMSFATDIEIHNKEVQSIKKDMIDIIKKHTNMSIKKIKKDIEHDCWMKPSEALICGVIDEIKTKK